MKIESEKEQPKNEEWYKAQYEELLDIRKIVYNIYPNICEGRDCYFPDLIKKKFEKLKILEEKV